MATRVNLNKFIAWAITHLTDGRQRPTAKTLIEPLNALVPEVAATGHAEDASTEVLRVMLERYGAWPTDKPFTTDDEHELIGLYRQMQRLDRQIAHLIDAIASASGGPIPALVDKLKAREEQRAILIGALPRHDQRTRLTGGPHPFDDDPALVDALQGFVRAVARLAWPPAEEVHARARDFEQSVDVFARAIIAREVQSGRLVEAATAKTARARRTAKVRRVRRRHSGRKEA